MKRANKPRMSGPVRRAGRKSAPEACRENLWGPGTVLVSSDWRSPRKVKFIGPHEVEMQEMRNGAAWHRPVYLKTFPDDTYWVDDPTLLVNNEAPLDG